MKRFVLALCLLFPVAAAMGQTPPCPNPQATLLEPADGAKSVPSPVTYRWSAVKDALGYEVWGSFDGGTPVLIGGSNDTTFTDNVPAATPIEWFVITNFTGCKTESAHFKFVTKACGGPATLTAPANNATATSPVTFTWNAPDGATGFRVWASKDAVNYDVIGETDQTSLTARLEPGTYDWSVETFFDGCVSAFSDPFRFTIARAATCPTAGPLLAGPTGDAVPNPVSFFWNPVVGALGYQVWAALGDGDFARIGETPESTTFLQADLGEGPVRWYVVAQFNACDDVRSDIGTFTIPAVVGCDHGAPLLISPADDDRDVPVHVNFIWTPVEDASGYKVWAAFGGGTQRIIATSSTARATADVQPGGVQWFIETDFPSCPPDYSPPSGFLASASAVCRTPATPDVFVDPEAVSGDPYLLIWSPGLNTSSYEVQEATNEAFSGAVTKTTTDIFLFFSHQVTSATRYFYRVRSLSSCGLGFGPYSEAAPIVVTPVVTATDSAEAATAYGTQTMVVQKVHIPGSAGIIGKTGIAAQNFTATTDKPWLTVTPASGTIPPEGIDLTVTADPRSLPVGTNTGDLKFTTTAQEAPKSVPVSVNLVTPVTPNPGNSPLPTSLFIPAVVHAQGAGTTFESDVRVANTSAQTMKYQITFTPTLTDGTKKGQQTTITVGPGETAALNDILASFYGFATAADNISGVLEIRPLNGSTAANAPTVTFASSRTYAIGSGGTFGQYIPAIPFSQFIGKAKDPAKPKKISLQQIAQSVAYRTNLGLVEGSGEPASLIVSVFGDNGQPAGQFPIDLKPGEHMQLNGFLASKGITANNARIEVQVTSTTGRVTAYASVLDNRTNDPMLILPVDPADKSASRFVIPGMADLNTGAASWRSDVRLYNSSSAAVPVTITFYPQGNPGSPHSVDRTVDAGQTLALDNALQSLFSMTNTGGSFVITTPRSAPLVASARTYNQTDAGTYGQFIPGLTLTDGTGMGDRPLQLLQVEESDRFRTNLGLVELTGNAATVEISATVPDSKTSVKTQVTLAPNEFKQFGRILASLGLGTTYNARISIRVIGGTGKVSGYASLIDNLTNDPAYVPAL